MRGLLLLAVLVTSGCVDPDVPAFLRGEDATPSGWTFEVEPSMAPDFRGAGETYPVLLVHSHHVPSPRQQEEARRNPVVCLDTEGAPLAYAGTPSRDMMASAPCAGAPVDAATGRLFMDRAFFERERPRAVVVVTDACSGGAVFLDEGREEFLVSVPGHAFRVRALPNGTFSVDGNWIAPAMALKVGFVLHRGDPLDEEHVRVAFDAPGGWLVSRVGTPKGDGGPPIPPRPDMGTGLAVDVRLSPATLGMPLAEALAATPGNVEGIRALRIVHDGERLTELTLRVATSEGDVLWYGAGRTHGALRLLGAQMEAAHEPALPVAALMDAFDREWVALRAGAPGVMTDVRLAPEVAWGTLGAAPLGLPDPAGAMSCEGGCTYARSERGWEQVLAPEAREAEGALTLAVLAFADPAFPVEVWWHVP